MYRMQLRFTVDQPNTWIKIKVPVGSKDFILALEDPEATFRISVDKNLDASSEGFFVDSTGQYSQEGTATQDIVLYLSSSKTTSAILQYN